MKRTKTYSLDIRERVLEVFQQGKTKTECAKQLKVSVSTVSVWMRRWKKTGNIKAKKRGGSKGKINAERLKQLVKENPCWTLWDFAKEFGVTDVAILKRFRKMKITYKKKNTLSKIIALKKDKSICWI